ncbi:MAG: hypothetical protein WCR46_24825 [Deltaproteobacteria bacterium]
MRDNTTSHLKGMTSNYIPVMVEGKDHLRNTLVVARIIRQQGEAAMFGVISNSHQISA